MQRLKSSFSAPCPVPAGCLYKLEVRAWRQASQGWEHRVLEMAAMVGLKACGERGCGWGWMSPVAVVRLQLSSSLLSCSVHAVPSPRLYLLWRLLRALLAFARRDHCFFTSGGVLWGGNWKNTGESGHLLPCCHPPGSSQGACLLWKML